MSSKEDFLSYTQNIYETERIYTDEPIRITPEKERDLPPKEYRQMRKLDFDNPFSRRNDAKIFYLQAKFMEDFEDDYDYNRPFFNYFPTYRNMTVSELRGYFTWRTRIRHGDLQKTSLSYAYLYLYELLHYIGSANAQEGFNQLAAFYENYRQLDKSIEKYAKRWIIDYGIYYHIEPERLHPYIDLTFDHTLATLLHAHDVSDAVLAQAIMDLSSYNLEKSKLYKQYPDEMTSILCAAYRNIDLLYQDTQQIPYMQKLYGKPVSAEYTLFRSAVFYPHERIGAAEYKLSEVQSFIYKDDKWYLNRSYTSEQKNKELGVFVRCCDRMLRQHYHVTPSLKIGDETDEMMNSIYLAIEQKRKAAIPKVTFQLDLLDHIRESANQIGEKLLTEEERMPDSLEPESIFTAHKDPVSHEDTALYKDTSPLETETSAASSVSCPISGNELEFMRILLYGGDLSAFLAHTHLMSSILAENINECLYDEFMDSVIDFYEDTPVIIEDYLQDLKGMIPE